MPITYEPRRLTGVILETRAKIEKMRQIPGPEWAERVLMHNVRTIQRVDQVGDAGYNKYIR